MAYRVDEGQMQIARLLHSPTALPIQLVPEQGSQLWALPVTVP